MTVSDTSGLSLLSVVKQLINEETQLESIFSPAANRIGGSRLKGIKLAEMAIFVSRDHEVFVRLS